MAVVLVSATKTFVGGSGDIKPKTGVPPGSIFWELTDGESPVMRQYIFDGSEWGLVVVTTESLEAE